MSKKCSMVPGTVITDMRTGITASIVGRCKKQSPPRKVQGKNRIFKVSTVKRHQRSKTPSPRIVKGKKRLFKVSTVKRHQRGGKKHHKTHRKKNTKKTRKNKSKK